MEMAVTVSPKYQVVIPEEVRKSLGIKPGQKFDVIEFEGCVELVPIKRIESLRGTLKGISTEVEREREDRV
ncbi:MAG: AbrB/MazE/SpoVT family DNA-binding domain-containing protein [Bdellovibrionota bacterium]